MSSITGERLTFLVVVFPFSKNTYASALAFTLDIIAQDDAADPTPTGTSFCKEMPIEYGYGESATEFRSMPVEV
jgi:hypothetical protein